MTTTPKVKKPTKREMLRILEDILAYAETEGYSIDGAISYENLNDFITRELELLDNKASAAQKRNEKKREENDELRKEVYSVLSSEPMTIEEVLNTLDKPAVTRSMLTSRLSALVKNGSITKEQATYAGADGKARRSMVYFKNS